MNPKLKIGITGCIGSGKSTVSKIFMQLGISVYDADSRAKILMVEDVLLIQKIKQIFGEESYQNGVLHRAFISSQAFQNKHLLEQLNGVVHPAVYKDFDNWCSAQTSSTYLIKEAALMFESESYKQLDKIIVVTAPQELRIERAMKRDGISRDAVLSRMKNQMSEEEKLSLGQFEIINNEIELLIPQVLKLHKQFGAV